MFRLMNSLKNRKGFTLIELIVVLAVLAVIMAIAVPKFMGIQDESTVKADAASAQSIISSAILQEASRNDGKDTVHGGASDNWNANLMAYPSPKNGDEFALTKTSGKYEVSWKVETGTYKTKTATVKEDKGFDITKDVE